VNWFNSIECDNTVANPYVAGVADMKGFDEWDFAYGKRIKNWDPTAYLQSDKPGDDGDLDDVLQHIMSIIPVYSKNLRDALKRGGIRGIQYLPLRVLRYDGSEIEGFAIANILNLVPCMDWARTEYRVKENRPGEVRSYGFGKLVVRRSALEGYDILRMKEFKLDIFVLERFKKIFEDGGFTGYSFSQLTLSE
jgi:hypothetical protein